MKGPIAVSFEQDVVCPGPCRSKVPSVRLQNGVLVQTLLMNAYIRSNTAIKKKKDELFLLN